MADTVKPPLVPLLEAVKALLVYHPITDEIILQFGCRIPFNDSMAMSYSLVHQAATVITQRNGYLSRSQDRGLQVQVVEADQDLIVAGNYYFHASDPALADYEIIGDFDSWEPPAGVDDLPEPWRTLTRRFNELEIEVPICVDANKIMDWVKRKDQVCMLTGSRDVSECQRLMPLAHDAWASHYHILRRASPHGYGNTIPITATRLIDDVRSLVTLSPSAHRLMADAFFCPYPLTDDGVYVAYFVILHRTDSGGEYHLRTLHLPERVSPYFLYLRFVWTMFRCVPPHNPAVRRKFRPVWAESEVGDVEDQGSIGGTSGDEDAPSDASSHPSITSDAEAKEHLIPPELLQLFADVEAGKRNPPAILYEYEQVYPGMARIARIREQYLKEHPQAVATSGSSTARHDGELEA